jgi:hypothetical protein
MSKIFKNFTGGIGGTVRFVYDFSYPFACFIGILAYLPMGFFKIDPIYWLTVNYFHSSYLFYAVSILIGICGVRYIKENFRQ